MIRVLIATAIASTIAIPSALAQTPNCSALNKSLMGIKNPSQSESSSFRAIAARFGKTVQTCSMGKESAIVAHSFKRDQFLSFRLAISAQSPSAVNRIFTGY